jgi:hypothetical protein
LITTFSAFCLYFPEYTNNLKATGYFGEPIFQYEIKTNKNERKKIKDETLVYFVVKYELKEYFMILCKYYKKRLSFITNDFIDYCGTIWHCKKRLIVKNR